MFPLVVIIFFACLWQSLQIVHARVQMSPQLFRPGKSLAAEKARVIPLTIMDLFDVPPQFGQTEEGDVSANVTRELSPSIVELFVEVQMWSQICIEVVISSFTIE